MLIIEPESLVRLSVHYVGDRDNGGSMISSPREQKIEQSTQMTLCKYFISPFIRNDIYYHFSHQTDINLNEVYHFVSSIFDNPNNFHLKSIEIVKHLFEKSNHPNIKSGEIYLAYFTRCDLDGETVEAIGIFKSENKETFLKVSHLDEYFNVESQEGININKLDKGCLIFNKQRDKGYVVGIVDNTNKGSEAHFWIDDFLHVEQDKNNYYKTNNVISMCKNYIVNQLPNEFEVSKVEQVEILRDSVKYFKNNDNFNMQEFTSEVIQEPSVIESFKKYSDAYQRQNNLELTDDFLISDAAVKKQSRGLKSVIKLDKNFHIYIHGNNQFIKRGFDEMTGKYYYQLFFDEES